MCVAIVAAWYFRADISDYYRSVVERPAEGASVQSTRGEPSASALQNALAKERAIARRGGPESVVLSADEMSALIEDRLSSDAREALDSISLTLTEDRLTLDATLETEAFGRDLLGPLRGMIDPFEPIRVSGTAAVRAPGLIGWDVDEFKVASFPFPQPAIPVLVERLTGGAGGIVIFAVPAEVDDLRIRPDGVTFYRRAR